MPAVRLTDLVLNPELARGRAPGRTARDAERRSGLPRALLTRELTLPTAKALLSSKNLLWGDMSRTYRIVDPCEHAQYDGEDGERLSVCDRAGCGGSEPRGVNGLSGSCRNSPLSVGPSASYKRQLKVRQHEPEGRESWFRTCVRYEGRRKLRTRVSKGGQVIAEPVEHCRRLELGGAKVEDQNTEWRARKAAEGARGSLGQSKGCKDPLC